MDWQRASELFEYDTPAGVLRYRIAYRGNSAGAIAGRKRRDGYVQVSIDGTTHLVHRLIFLVKYGRWPSEIDHINGDRSDNRLSNLREISHAANNWNQPNLRRTNTSGFAGVVRKRGHWEAQIRCRGTHHYLGSFGSPEEAAAAHERARRLRDSSETFEALAKYCGVDAPARHDGDPP